MVDNIASVGRRRSRFGGQGALDAEIMAAILPVDRPSCQLSARLTLKFASIGVVAGQGRHEDPTRAAALTPVDLNGAGEFEARGCSAQLSSNFYPVFAQLAEQIAVKTVDRATAVGSGHVGRTQMLSLD